MVRSCFLLIVRELNGRTYNVGSKLPKSFGISLFWHIFSCWTRIWPPFWNIFWAPLSKIHFFAIFGVKLHFLAIWSTVLPSGCVFESNIIRTEVNTQFKRIWRPYRDCKLPKTGQKGHKTAKNCIFPKNIGVI